MPSKYEPLREGTFYSEKHGRVVVHHGYATWVFWNKDMLDYLKQHFATTLNEELAGCLGVSVRTMIRKARELGLEKDKAWLASVWEERRKMATVEYKRKGYPGGFPKGVRSNPDGEFKKGHVESDETKAKRIASVKRWCRLNPEKVMRRALKIAESRCRNKNKTNN